jgi:hypothetical protein
MFSSCFDKGSTIIISTGRLTPTFRHNLDFVPGTTVLEEIMSEKKRESANADVLPAKVAVMRPILRFLQLLCENHNPDLQVLCY